MVALTNVTSTARELLLPLSELGTSSSAWRDVLTDRWIRADGDSLRVPLDAYDVIWLESSSE
jgi:hypothetical protein